MNKPFQIIEIQPRLFRGPQPRGQVASLQVFNKVTHVISLHSGWFDAFNEIRDGKRPRLSELEDECHAHGIEFFPIPCSDFSAPTIQQTKNFLSSVTSIIRDPNNVVYFHCLHGVDRTGWMAAAWRVQRMRWSADAAIYEWDKLGRNKWFYWTWPSKFKAVMASISGDV